MPSHFLAYMARTKLIRRWSLMRNTIEENDLEHTAMVTMIAHTLCAIKKTRYGEEADTLLALEYAIYHEAAEVITGDLASPIKYFNPQIKDAFKRIEHLASEKMLSYLPADLAPQYEGLLFPDAESVEWRIVKAADKISAYLKCVEEARQGNMEFVQAQETLLKQIQAMQMPEVHDFMEEFAPSFRLTIDGMN